MRLAIVAEGGGLRGAYALGSIWALYSHFGILKIDYATGSSASIGTLAYYIAEQLNSARHIWEKEIISHKFLSFRNIINGHPFLNVDYLIDHIFKMKIPLNEKKVRRSKTKLIIPLTNAETGEAEYYNNRSNVDFFEILRAAMAIPFAYNKTVEIGSRRYFDGGVSDPLPINIPEIKNSRKIIILTKPRNNYHYNLSDSLMLMLFKMKFKPRVYNSLKIKSMIYEQRLNEIERLELEGDVVISPSIKMSRYDNKPETIQHNIRKGYNDTISNQKLTKFIKMLKS